MCGIVGAASRSLVGNEVKNFEDLMIVSNLRGKQGAGAIVVRDMKVHAVKSIYSGIDVVEMNAYVKNVWTNKGNLSALVGHTRYPTKGGVELESVHPHAFKNLMGVHNGTLNKVDGKYVGKDESDSYLLYKHISEVGIEEALKQAEGAYALVFVDYPTGRLNFIRNHARPLFFAKVNWNSIGSRALYWASEKAFLQLVLGRNNVKFDIEELPVNELWTIPLKFHEDFTKKQHIYSNVRAWSPATEVREADEHWYDAIPFRKQGNSSFVTLPSTVGPELSKINDPGKGHNNHPKDVKSTFVVRDGVVVRKGHEDKQVTLPRTDEQLPNEHEGTQEDGVPVHQAGDKAGVPDKQRDKADAKVQHPASVPLVPRHALSKDEQAFIDDTVDDVYAGLPSVKQILDDAFDKVSRTRMDDNGTELLVETEKGTWLPYSQIKKLCKSGCAYCGESVEDYTELAWLDNTQYLCEPCQSSEESLRIMHDFYPHSQIMTDWRDGKLRDVPPPPDHFYPVTDSTEQRAILH